MCRTDLLHCFGMVEVVGCIVTLILIGVLFMPSNEQMFELVEVRLYAYEDDSITGRCSEGCRLTGCCYLP